VKALGLERVPAVIREADDQDMQTLALVENLQRVDLNAMEKARALQAMMRNFGFTQQEVADRVGKARTSISNLVRLLDLQAEIQDLVSDGSLSGAQARALLLVKGPEARLALAMRAVREGLTVRRIEQLAAEKRKPRSGTSSAPDPYLADLEERLRRALGTTVALKASGGGGRIEIRYHDAGELDRLLELFGAA
jgi:ParB family chromosome partitioning protein